VSPPSVDLYKPLAGPENSPFSQGASRDCHLDMQRAISCGLIVNELITNAFKHAFPEGRAGSIEVSLADAGAGRICLCVADDGVGLPADIDLGSGQSLGLRLLPSLVEQLGGEVVLRRTGGTRYELTFSL